MTFRIPITRLAPLALMALVLSGLALTAAATEEPDPGVLWSEIAGYQEWDNFPDHQGIQPGKAPHGPLHEVFVNDVALDNLGVPLPAGSVIVKENYTPEKKLAAVTVMVKVEGYNPEAGDWYWVKYAPDGTPDKFGMPAGCINCHGANAANDWVWVQPLD